VNGLPRFSGENLAMTGTFCVECIPNLSFTTSDLWTWAVKRIDDELEQDLVKSQGYLEGKTWLDFTNEFITLIDGAKKQKDSKFYTSKNLVNEPIIF